MKFPLILQRLVALQACSLLFLSARAAAISALISSSVIKKEHKLARGEKHKTPPPWRGCGEIFTKALQNLAQFSQKGNRI
ncbi:MAG: hypothetical protein IJP78_00390 [Clostridia bacterium]|nr:hypothetical protein [Clostridia bacterium]